MFTRLIQIRNLAYRPEQKKLRNHLLQRNKPVCALCHRRMPHYILECAHIKPRVLCLPTEKVDFDNVEWMCRNCHKLFDTGHLGINNKRLFSSEELQQYSDLRFVNETDLENDYFDYHFNHIFKK
jgi:predicted restriction endonuclease